MIDYEKCKRSAEYILSRSKLRPATAIILGSGLGALTKELSEGVKIPYGEIEALGCGTTNGAHEGALYIGKLDGVEVALFSGRFHYYEQYGFDKAGSMVGVMKLMGIEKMIVTNAAGAVNPEFKIGDFVIIKDHIKFFTESPVRGNVDSEFGERFFDLSDIYSSKLRAVAKECGKEVGEELKEGVYFFMPGPQYETPAEIRAIRILGGDLVGMSTVPEVITAGYCKLKVLGISCVTNMAAGVAAGKINDAEVVEVTGRSSVRFSALIKKIVKEIDKDAV